MCHPCTIMWEADVPPAVGCIAAAPSLASLDQGLLGHSIWDEVCVCLGLSKFSFSYRNIVGTGCFSGRAIMQPQDVVLLDMPSSHSHSLLALGNFLGGPSCSLGMLFYWICSLVTPTPCRHWGIFWEGHHAASGCCSIAMPSSHSHSHTTSAWFASSPLHLPFTYPFHTTRSGSALLTSST